VSLVSLVDAVGWLTVADDALPPWFRLNRLLPDMLVCAGVCLVVGIVVLMLRRRVQAHEARNLELIREAEAAADAAAAKAADAAAGAKAEASPAERRGEP